MTHPGIIRKQLAKDRKSRGEQQIQNGAISLLVVYITDIITSMWNFIINMASSYRMSGSKFMYDIIYKDGVRLIPSAEKYGAMVPLKPLLILLTIMYPPLGLFLSRGIYGLHHVAISYALTKYNLLFGICYAMVIIHIPHYADRYAKYDYYRLLTIRQLVSNCKNIIFNNTKAVMPLIIFVSAIVITFTVIFILTKHL